MIINNLLKQITPPELPQHNDGDWDLIFEQLGTKLPSDYIDFISHYGSGLLGGFYIVLNPFTDNEFVNLTRRLETVTEMFSGDPSFQEENYKIYPKHYGLLPCMIDENGNDYFWLTREDPEIWNIVQCEHRGDGFKIHPENITSFLTGIFDKRIEPLASNFPNTSSYTFRSFGET